MVGVGVLPGTAAPTGTVVVRVVRRMTLPVAGSSSSVTSVTCWVAAVGLVMMVGGVVVLVGVVWAVAARGKARSRAAREGESFMVE